MKRLSRLLLMIIFSALIFTTVSEARFFDSCSGRWTTRDPLEETGGLNLYQAVGNDPVNNIDPLGLYIGQLPPAPPGFNSGTWQQGLWDNGKWYLKSPDGRIYTAHAEDESHWRHWDKQNPSGKDDGSWPPNPGKRRPGQKKLKPKQCDNDPSGSAPEWRPIQSSATPEYMPFMPFEPFGIPSGLPLRIPIRIPIPVW